jgi:hypothetical protein
MGNKPADGHNAAVAPCRPRPVCVGQLSTNLRRCHEVECDLGHRHQQNLLKFELLLVVNRDLKLYISFTHLCLRRIPRHVDDRLIASRIFRVLFLGTSSSVWLAVGTTCP